MQIFDYRTSMLTHKDNESVQTSYLARIASRWDSTINRELQRFAQFLWPDARLLGLIPIHSYRLRKRLDSEMIVWWVERDIPPFDRYRCEAYRVELSLAESGQPMLVVRSGNSSYPVAPMSVDDLKMALTRAGADKSLVIQCEFEPALDT
jgi:hypothetical protein